MILRLKGSAASDHLVDGDPCSPDVDLLIVAAPAEHLRRPVVQSSSDGQHIDPDASSLVLPADAEVNQLELLAFRVIEDVLGFDVTVGY